MVGDSKRRLVIIYSNIELINGNSAASARVMNYARALALECDVLIVSFKRSNELSLENSIEIEKGIFTSGIEDISNKYIQKLLYPVKVLYFVLSLHKFGIHSKERFLSFLLYPSTEVLMDFFSIIILKKLFNYRVFYEVNEVRRFSSKYLVYGYKYKLFTLKYRFAEWMTKFYDGLICISTSLERYFEKYNSNIIRVPILSEIVENSLTNNTLFKRGDAFKIGFFGSVNYTKENFNDLLKSIVFVKQTKTDIPFFLDLYGPIDKDTDRILFRKVKELALNGHVFYKGIIEQKRVLNTMKKYDLLVLPRGNNLQNQYGFSTKLSEYLSSGTIVLITDVSDNAMYIKDSVNGFIVEPNSYKLFGEKLVDIIVNYENYNKVGLKGVETVRQYFAYNVYTRKLVDFLCKK